MALTLAIPLIGLNNEYFSTLNMRLLNVERERAFRDLPEIFGRNSPSTGSETSGISSFVTSVESTPISSRSETPTDTFCKRQNKTDGSNPKAVRIMYSGRDILNLESNIRQPFWQLREPTLTRNYHNFVVNRTTYNQLREQALTKDYPTKCCKECGFYTPSPIC